jgi:hypothetical protein
MFAAALCLGTVSPALAATSSSSSSSASTLTESVNSVRNGADITFSYSRPAPASVFARAFGGHGPGALSHPDGIAIGADGNVRVSDTGRDRIEGFSPAGTYLSSFPVATPHGVAIDGSGDVWVSSPTTAS